MPGHVVLDTDRPAVSLRSVERADADFLHRWRNHPDVRRWMPRAHAQRRPDVVEEIEGFVADRDDGLQLLVCDDSGGDDEDHSDGDPVGMVTLFDEHPTDRTATLSAWVAPPRQGEGFAAAALDAIVAHAFDERDLAKLKAGALATNEPSRATLESAGFREELRVRERYFVDGDYVDRVQYGLLADEWRDGNRE